MILKLKKAFAVITGALLFCNTCVIAAELKMIGNPGMSEIMTSIVPEFERNTGIESAGTSGFSQNLSQSSTKVILMSL
jgi:hypothetical protein